MEEMAMDRLSNLPDTIIHEILSLLSTGEAVKTCVLSKTWKYQWTHTHTLILHLDYNFANRNLEYLENFVLHMLRRRHPLCKLNRILLRFDGYYFMLNKPKQMMNNLFDYVLSQELQELKVNFVPDLTSSFFKCQTLKTLKLGLKYSYGMNTLLSKTLEFASLKTLKLGHVYISDENIDQSLFSNCLNLENLKLHHCHLDSRFKTFIINLPRLVNLIILYLRCNVDMFEISTPRLKSFELSTCGDHLAGLNMVNCPILEEVKLDSWFQEWKEEHLSHMMFIAKRLSHAKSLTMSLQFMEPRAIIRFTNAFDREIKLEEQHKQQNFLLMIRQLKFLDINQMNESKVKNILEIIDNSEEIIDKSEEIEFEFGGLITHGEYLIPIGNTFFDYSIVLPKLLKYETLKTLTLKGPCSFRILSSLSLGFKSLTNLKLSGTSIEYGYHRKKKDLRICDLFSGCFNLEKLELSEFGIKNVETLNIKAPRLLHLTISIDYWSYWGEYEHYHHQRDDQGENDRKIVIISSPRLKFFEFKLSMWVDTVQLRLDNCSMLEEVNIPYALPLIVWRERCDWNRRYILDMMLTNDRSRSFNRYALLWALKFSRGKFTSYHIHLDEEVEDEEVEVMEFEVEVLESNDMEERFWFFDGLRVRQSSPCRWDSSTIEEYIYNMKKMGYFQLGH